MAPHRVAERLVSVPAGTTVLEGSLQIPAGAQGIVIFAHGSGSSRFSPRNRYVAQVLAEAGLATLLMDLLTADEDAVDQAEGRLRFDIPLLAQRVVAALDWATADPLCGDLSTGLFGASTGAAAALIAGTERPQRVRAIVSRGGRPDLARDALARVWAATLLIVGEYDPQVLALNRDALSMLAGEREMAIVPGATHLFEEPGTLEQVAALAANWFTRYLRGNRAEGLSGRLGAWLLSL